MRGIKLKPKKKWNKLDADTRLQYKIYYMHGAVVEYRLKSVDPLGTRLLSCWLFVLDVSGKNEYTK